MSKSKKQGKDSKAGSRGEIVLDIPLDQILLDPHQPRKRFTQKKIVELAESIKAKGLQQFPHVTFAYEKGGKKYYYLKAGERRLKAHQYLGLPTMTCIVVKEKYEGKLDIERLLAQSAENSSREPQSHGEMINLTEKVVEDTKVRMEGRKGYIEVALQRVAVAHGFTAEWARVFHNLSGLIPEFREMLDEEDEERKLNFNIAKLLCTAPPEKQKSYIKRAEPYFRRGGYAAGYNFLARTIRHDREKGGEKVRGRRSDEKSQFQRIGPRLIKLYEEFLGGRRSSEYRQYVADALTSLSSLEVDALLRELNTVHIWFASLRDATVEERNRKYGKLQYKGQSSRTAATAAQ